MKKRVSQALDRVTEEQRRVLKDYDLIKKLLTQLCEKYNYDYKKIKKIIKIAGDDDSIELRERIFNNLKENKGIDWEALEAQASLLLCENLCDGKELARGQPEIIKLILKRKENDKPTKEEKEGVF